MKTEKLKNWAVENTGPRSTASLTVSPSVSTALVDREKFDITKRLQRPSLMLKEIFWLMAGKDPSPHEKILYEQDNLFQAVKQAIDDDECQASLRGENAASIKTSLKCKEACRLATQNAGEQTWTEPSLEDDPNSLSWYKFCQVWAECRGLDWDALLAADLAGENEGKQAAEKTDSKTAIVGSGDDAHQNEKPRRGGVAGQGAIDDTDSLLKMLALLTGPKPTAKSIHAAALEVASGLNEAGSTESLRRRLQGKFTTQYGTDYPKVGCIPDAIKP